MTEPTETTITSRLATILYTSDQIDRTRFPLLASLGKLMEEVGEFSEEVLISQGLLPHKQSKEGTMGEGADIIICLMDVICATHPGATYEDILARLDEQLCKKTRKWQNVCMKKGD